MSYVPDVGGSTLKPKSKPRSWELGFPDTGVGSTCAAPAGTAARASARLRRAKLPTAPSFLMRIILSSSGHLETPPASDLLRRNRPATSGRFPYMRASLRHAWCAASEQA